MEDKDGPLLRRQPAEAAIELIAVVDRQVLVARDRVVHVEQDHIGRMVPSASGLGVAGVDENPVEPRLEPIEVAEGGELLPGLDEGHLDCVLGKVGVAQDPVRDEDAAVADRANQGAEGLLVAMPRLLNDVPQHPLSLMSAPLWRLRNSMSPYHC